MRSRRAPGTGTPLNRTRHSRHTLPVQQVKDNWRYRVAGIDVESDFAWAEGAPGDAATPPGLVVLDGDRHGLPRPAAVNTRSADGQRVRFVVDGVGCFLVEDGRRIVAWPDAGVDPPALSQQLAGSALAMALTQRGTLVLHGAVVRIAGQALVLLGHTGEGKSTLAGACAAAGHAVLSDDLAILDETPTGWMVRGVASLVRLIEPTAPAGHGPVWTAFGKEVRLLRDDGGEPSAPLAGVVCLEWGTAVEVVEQAGVTAALTLLEHAYCRPAFRSAQAARALEQSTRLAMACPLRALRRPRDLALLPLAAQALEQMARVRQ